MTTKDVVEAYSIALGKGDIPTAFSYFNPNAKWHQPGRNKFSGTQTSNPYRIAASSISMFISFSVLNLMQYPVTLALPIFFHTFWLSMSYH
jgi:hypothetical protein